MSLQKLRNLAITKVYWHGSIPSLGFTSSDGKSCRAGRQFNFTKSHVFDPSKKITKILTTVEKKGWWIEQIKFFSGEEELCRVGYTDDDWMLRQQCEVESFEIADDEQLIGCQLDQSTEKNLCHFRGVTWLKMKVKFRDENESKETYCLKK